MKSKLTLRLDEDVKKRAKKLAKRRGTSVSKIVEDYFRVLLREETDSQEAKGPEGKEPRNGPEEADGETLGRDVLNRVPEDLPPRTGRMLQEVGPASGSLDVDEETRAWIDAAHEKHK